MMMKIFGTDGIRGTANQHPITADCALKIGMAAGLHFGRNGHRNRVLIGKDTRLSGYMIESALTAGFISVGVDPILVGPLPTPAVAMLTRSLRADMGVMITASHNPYRDNGIKMFGPDGYKLSNAMQDEIEALINGDMTANLAPPEKLGQARRLDDAQGRYTEFVKQTFPKGLRLDGLKIVLDCANGAAYKVAPDVLWELGAEVITVGTEPDGTNINLECGATCTKTMRSQVIANEADLGIALDGDADRLMVSDETGALVDGDQIIALIAGSWAQAGLLKGGGVVATVMSNLGLERHLADCGLSLTRSAVGDRNVVECMRKSGCNIGGEPSGHIILGDYGTTGDGLVSALQVLGAIIVSERPASETCRVFQPVPQRLCNVPYVGDRPLEQEQVAAAIVEGERLLGDDGRLIVRKSGTEPLIRIMAEGSDRMVIEKIINDVAGAIRLAA